MLPPRYKWGSWQEGNSKESSICVLNVSGYEDFAEKNFICIVKHKMLIRHLFWSVSEL